MPGSETLDPRREALLRQQEADDDPLQSLTFSNMSDVGTQYPLLKNGDTTFLGRVAGGFSRDYAGLAEGQRIPEVLFGCQFEHQITQRHKILGAVESPAT